MVESCLFIQWKKKKNLIKYLPHLGSQKIKADQWREKGSVLKQYFSTMDSDTRLQDTLPMENFLPCLVKKVLQCPDIHLKYLCAICVAQTVLVNFKSFFFLPLLPNIEFSWLNQSVLILLLQVSRDNFHSAIRISTLCYNWQHMIRIKRGNRFWIVSLQHYCV